MKIIIILFILIIPHISIFAEIDTFYKFEVTGELSPVINYYKYPRYPGATQRYSIGYSGFVKCNWHPGKLFSLGLMSGIVYFAQDRLHDAFNSSASLSAIPLQFVVFMGNDKFEIGVGMGPYLMLSSVTSGNSASGIRSELGITLIANYNFSESKNFFIGPELKFLILSFRGIYSLMPSICIKFPIYRY